jgi:radical SAM protein with 4Fe4S-binding SPASM domain
MLQAYQLHSHVRLRRAPGGGTAFLPDTVTTVELDSEAFATLAFLDTARTARDLRCRLISRFGRNFTLAEVEILLRELAELGFVHPASSSSSSKPPAAASAPAPGVWDALPAPESVHLQLNNVCNLRCPSCYVGLQDEDIGSLPLERLFELIDEWAGMGVFQLALGGGEPLMSPKFPSVVRRARERGIVPNVTTNGWLITPELLDHVAGSIGELRLSLNDTISVNAPLLEERAALMRSCGVRFGFNLIVTRPNLGRLPHWLRWACAQGAATVNLIRPKPAPGNAGWYSRNALGPADSLQLARLLHELEPLFERTTLAVDCAFSFLFHGRPAEELRAHGVAGCAMGDRFAVVTWEGDVYPCSHLRGEEFLAGSVRTGSFRAIWERSAAFTRLRLELPQVEGVCGGCAHNPFCKGCRAVMQAQTGDWLAADHGCGFGTALAHPRDQSGGVEPFIPIPQLPLLHS